MQLSFALYCCAHRSQRSPKVGVSSSLFQATASKLRDFLRSDTIGPRPRIGWYHGASHLVELGWMTDWTDWTDCINLLKEKCRMFRRSTTSKTWGIDHIIKTPFGVRRLVYSDFTASGRALRWVDPWPTLLLLSLLLLLLLLLMMMMMMMILIVSLIVSLIVLIIMLLLLVLLLLL